MKNSFNKLSFRWKAIVFIATVEGMFSIIFAFIIVGMMANTAEEQFFKRASITAQLFATTTSNSVLSTDLASLESFVEEVMRNEDLLYARVYDNSGLLVQQARNTSLLTREFILDMELSEVEDEIFDSMAEIKVDGEVYGMVEIGLSTALLGSTISMIKWEVIGIGTGEILISALISYLLGGFLVRRLYLLESAAQRIANGEYGVQVEIDGEDELAKTAKAFNIMSRETSEIIYETRSEMEAENRERLKAEERLRYTAFQAGIAEMAASVLHNIGNAVTGIQHRVSSIMGESAGLEKIAEALDIARLSQPPSADMDKEQFFTMVMGEAAKSLRAIHHKRIHPDGEALEKAVHHVSDIIRTHQSASKTETENSPFLMTGLLENAVHMLEDSCRKNAISINLDADDSLPMVNLPRNLLLQMVVNLLKNGKEAIVERKKSDPGLAGQISLRTKASEDGWFILEVEDNGCGIEAGKLDKMFRFGYTTKINGSGIGLHSAANFVRGMGGRLEVASDGINRGITITGYLPVLLKKKNNGEEAKDLPTASDRTTGELK
jgi:two-component system, NtrC family, sensor kinase